MKAFIMTILAPDDWKKSDPITAFNIGVKYHAPELKPMEYNAMVIDDFELKETE